MRVSLALWPVAVLVMLVIAIRLTSSHPRCAALFHWLPAPLWCYALPMTAVALGWLPAETPGRLIYRPLGDLVLPIALVLLLIGVDLPAVMHTGRRALLIAAIGAVAIIAGAPLGVWVFRTHLPAGAWTGAGALAGTWTGGTMNLLALRSALAIPDAVFTPLVVVDALIAYGWMALLVAASGAQHGINRWLRATSVADDRSTPVTPNTPPADRARSLVLGCLLALMLAAGCRALAIHLPRLQLINSSSGWTVLLVTTAALALAMIPRVRMIGAQGSTLGYPCLYLVLAATGAQASVRALWSAPVWIILGLGVVVLHGAVLLLAGRLLRVPLGVLATASQANIGGVVSAPLVGAVYNQSLVPVGLLLAVAGNALGTYCGLLSATLCRWLLRA